MSRVFMARENVLSASNYASDSRLELFWTHKHKPDRLLELSTFEAAYTLMYDTGGRDF